MLQALDGEPLHAGGGVVRLPAPHPHQVGVVSSRQKLGQKHFLLVGSENIQVEINSPKLKGLLKITPSLSE